MITVLACSVFNAIYSVAFFTGEIPQTIQNDFKKPEFSQCSTVQDYISTTLLNLNRVLQPSDAEFKADLLKLRDDFVEKCTADYLNKKADIIKNEFKYVAKNYKDDESSYSSYGISTEYVNSIPDTPLEQQKYPVDPYAPASVQAVQKILNYAQGQEFLKYDVLVREDAFYENDYYFDYTLKSSLTSFTYLLEYHLHDYSTGGDEIKRTAPQWFNNRVSEAYSNLLSDKESAAKELEGLVNIKYYVKNGSIVYTNMTDAEIKSSSVESYPIYYFNDGNSTVSDGFDTLNHIRPKDALTNAEYAKIFLCDEIRQGDKVATINNIYNALNIDLNRDIIISVIALFLAIAVMVCLINLSGHTVQADGIKTAFIDRLPGDIHTVLSGGIITFLVFAVIAIPSEFDYDLYYSEFFIRWIPILLGVLCAAVWAVFFEWVLSIVRVKKAGQPWFLKFITVRIVLAVFRFLKKLFKKIVGFFKKSSLKYKPNHIRRRFFVLICAYVVFNFIMVFIYSANIDYGNDGWAFADFLLIMAVNIAMLIFAGRYLKNLDKIISAAKERKIISFYGEKIPPSLETLNECLKVTNEEMNAAVENAVKNERTKTELITNVSHDLKTPLTSVISYVDLLKKCDIQDEDALKYIGILEEKSANLKNLIENLVEASKVSSGNIKLNKTVLSLKELAIQALVESAPEFESRGLELIFDENCEPITIFADGQQTYRVIENLLSNAKKYSAQGTRVYASIRRENSQGIFEIKNISKAPLNISPQELTERFVRGDSSRGTEEGNGLGLSIAKELCSLQNGRLEISIDGDLFKATVRLPIG